MAFGWLRTIGTLAAMATMVAGAVGVGMLSGGAAWVAGGCAIVGWVDIAIAGLSVC